MEIAARMLKDLTVTVAAKGGGAGRLFGSVTTQEIADALQAAAAGSTLDKRKIVLDEPIKTVGHLHRQAASSAMRSAADLQRGGQGGVITTVRKEE